MKIQERLQLAVISGYWICLILFLIFLYSVSCFSFEGECDEAPAALITGKVAILILLHVNVITLFYSQTIAPSLRSPLFLGLVVNITVLGVGIFDGHWLPFSLEDLILFVLAMMRGELHLSINQWYAKTTLVEWTCLLAGIGAMTDGVIIIWHTWLHEMTAKHLAKLNRAVT